LPAQRGDNGRRVFAGDIDQHGTTRMTLHQCGDVTVLRAAEQIALPMAGDGAVLDLCGPFSHGDGIDNLTAGLSSDTRVPRATDTPLGLFVRHAHALVLGIPNLQPSRNLFR
jgi:hypothetical protein